MFFFGGVSSVIANDRRFVERHEVTQAVGSVRSELDEVRKKKKKVV